MLPLCCAAGVRVVLRPGSVTPEDIAAAEGWEDVRVWKVRGVLVMWRQCAVLVLVCAMVCAVASTTRQYIALLLFKFSTGDV